MKQILSVADFGLILGLVNKELDNVEKPLCSGMISEKEYAERKKEHMEHLQTWSFYKSLIHLKEALENLNIEVEVPDVEVMKNGNKE